MQRRDRFVVVRGRIPFLPDTSRDEVALAEHLVHEQPEIEHLVVVDVDERRAGRANFFL